MRRVAVLQSNYVPWKGYFDIIHDVDVFVFYDDVQYTKNDWRNRNIVKSPSGPAWLTIPVGAREDRRICDVRLPQEDWARRHWRILQQAYHRAPFFGRYAPWLEEVYLSRRWEGLSSLNHYLITTIAVEHLGITTRFCDSRQFDAEGTKADRLLDLLRKVGTDVYVSGPSARSYTPEERFADAGIRVVWKDYDGYPEYPQLYPPFAHRVTILDLLFHVGPEAPYYIWGWRSGPRPSPPE